MRTIKFRGWDSFNNKMCMPEQIQNGVMTKAPDDYEGYYLTLMQFTGLLDKHGKEIYEGDLIKTSGDTKIQISDGKEVHSPHWRIAKIVFVEGCFKQIVISQENAYFGKLPSQPTGIFQPHIHDEVIGNIYENPELLEVK